MTDKKISLPAKYKKIKADSLAINFDMPSDLQTGSLLRTLVSTKINGRFLELGTGTGLSLSWMVAGMDEMSSIISIDNNSTYQDIAERYFGEDKRVNLICADANEWIADNEDRQFDLIFADAWPGKFESLEEVFNILKPGGIYLIDDMLEQNNWPSGHQENVNELITYLESRKDLILTKLNWSTGLILIVKI